MWRCIGHFIQYAGLITAAAFLSNGIAFNPFAAADDAEIDASVSDSLSFQSPFEAKKSDPSISAVDQGS